MLRPSTRATWNPKVTISVAYTAADTSVCSPDHTSRPIFVQGSAPNSFPLLQRVAVFYNNKVGFADGLTEAIAEVVTGQQQLASPGDGGGEQPPPTPTPGGNQSVQSLLQRANQEYQAAQKALAAGDLAEYQRHIDSMGQLVQQALSSQGDGGSGPTTTTRP